MLAHAFGTFETVNFKIGESNLRSKCAIEKVGAILVDRRILDAKLHCIYQVKRDYFFASL